MSEIAQSDQGDTNRIVDCMKENKIPEISFKSFIHPGNEKSKNESVHDAAHTLLEMIQPEQNAGDKAAKCKTPLSFDHAAYACQYEAPEYDFLIRHGKQPGYEQNKNVAKQRLSNKIEIGNICGR